MRIFAPVLLVLALALPLRAAPEAAAPALPQDRAVLEEDLESDAISLDSMLKDLLLLNLEYPAKAGLAPFSARRGKLLEELALKRASLSRSLPRLKELKSLVAAQRQAVLLSGALGKGPKAEPAAGEEEFARLARIIQKADAALLEYSYVVPQDEAAFNAALAGRKGWRSAWLVMGAACLLSFLSFLALRKRRVLEPQLVEPEPVPAAAPAPRPAPVPTPAPASRPALRDGTVLGGSYRVVRELAKGSLGPAFEAVELSTGRKVVLKRLRDEFHRSERDLDRLLAEARRVSSLKHPNAAEVLSVFIEAERVHLAVELVAGEPLARSLGPGRRLDLPSVKNILWQVSSVVDYAHSAGLLHGDLRPSNVIVDKEGLVKVCDFGIGRVARQLTAKASWTDSPGAMAHLAPEQELGAGDKGSDVYSLGVLLYEMLTGRLPFEGPDFLGQKRALAFRPPSALGGRPAALDAVVLKALQPDPGLRYASAGDLFDAFEKVAP